MGRKRKVDIEALCVKEKRARKIDIARKIDSDASLIREGIYAGMDDLDDFLNFEGICDAWLKSRNDHLIHALELHYDWKVPLPDWLMEALREILVSRIPKAQWRDRARWLKVRQGRTKGLTWPDSYEYAARMLADNANAKGSPAAMKWSYYRIQGEGRK
jgi:hypothetical protein